MGTITARRRRDGSVGYTAQIRLKKAGKIIYTEAETFERRAAATAWLRKRETELAQPGAIEAARAPDPTLGEVIAEVIRDSRRDLGRTKEQVLRKIAAAPLGSLRCSDVTSPEIVAFARSLEVKPQTVANYLAHLGSVFSIARPAWGYPLDKQAIDDARIVCERLGLTGKSAKRDRRPSLEELDAILSHFAEKERFGRQKIPMVDFILFALFSTRRLEEITRLAWADLDEARSEIIVRDMKHPGEKVGNDVRTALPEEALAVILRQPRGSALIFPYNHRSAGTNFARACEFLEIEDLHFHDLRHEGISHQFELGQMIPIVASISGHRSWVSLKRYTHIQAIGDRFAGWRWRPALPAKEAAPSPATAPDA